MSRGWKIAIGIVVGLVVLALIALPTLGRFVFGWNAGPWRDWMSARYEGAVFPGIQPPGEVRLIDEDGDGVPDRGVLEGAPSMAYEDLPAHLGTFGRSLRLPFRPGLSHFPVFGGIFRLAFLALLIGGGIYVFRRWRRPSSPPAQAGPQ